MKVPYLKKKRRSDMLALTTEFSTAIGDHLKKTAIEKRVETEWMKSMYPLFALLQLLDDSGDSLNPSREYALIGAAAEENREIFLQAMYAFQTSSEISRAMQSAYKKTMFSGFISELRSDLLMAMVQGLMFAYRGIGIGLRCALEDLYRHLYYMDHPQEFHALQKGESEYAMKLSPQFFRDYLRRTSYLTSLSSVSLNFSSKEPESMDWFGVNEQLYSDLSAAVHGASGEWFASISNANSLAPNEIKEKKLERLLENFSKMCVTFLIAAHRDVFASGGDYDKSLVLEIYNSDERKNFRKLLNI